MGLGRMSAEGENRKLVRECLNSYQKRPESFQIEQQDMAGQIFGVPPEQQHLRVKPRQSISAYVGFLFFAVTSGHLGVRHPKW